MADRLVRSGGASGLWTGTVYTTLAAAIAASVAGDRFLVSDAHSESTAGAVTLAFPGTRSNPNQILVCTDAGGPAGALSTGAIVAATGTNNITLTGTFFCRGVSFRAASGANSGDLRLANATGDHQIYDSCELILNGSGGGTLFIGTSSNHGLVVLNNCSYKFASSSHAFAVNSNAATALYINGGGFISGTTSPTNLFSSLPAILEIDGLDLSVLSSSFNFNSTTTTSRLLQGKNIKLPPSWSGLLASASRSPGMRAILVNTDSANTNYRNLELTDGGTIRNSTAVYVTADPADGNTPLSYLLTADSNNKYPATYVKSPPIRLWNDVVGSSRSITVELACDGAIALTDQDAWLEYLYLGDSASSKSSFATTMCSPIASATPLPSSSASWTGATGTGPNGSNAWNLQKLVATFTAQKKSVIEARVCFALPNKSVYVSPPTGLT